MESEKRKGSGKGKAILRDTIKVARLYSSKEELDRVIETMEKIQNPTLLPKRLLK